MLEPGTLRLSGFAMWSANIVCVDYADIIQSPGYDSLIQIQAQAQRGKICMKKNIPDLDTAAGCCSFPCFRHHLL